MILPAALFPAMSPSRCRECFQIYTDEAIRQMFAVGGDPQGGSGRGAAWADAVQDQRTRRFQKQSAHWRLAPPLFSPTADEATGFEAAPFMILGVIGSSPAQPEDRSRFAQQSQPRFRVRDARITMSEPDPHRRHGRI